MDNSFRINLILILFCVEMTSFEFGFYFKLLLLSYLEPNQEKVLSWFGHFHKSMYKWKDISISISILWVHTYIQVVFLSFPIRSYNDYKVRLKEVFLKNVVNAAQCSVLRINFLGVWYQWIALWNLNPPKQKSW